MKKHGAAHTFAERQLMKQVAEVFSAKKRKPWGARAAAKELGISLASFYNYANGTDLPRLEVLKRAHKKWKVDWILIDMSTLVRVREYERFKQLPLPLEELSEKDVTVTKIDCVGKNVLRVSLKIHFAA